MERKGFANPASLEILTTWYLAGAQPPTLTECASLPAWLLHDRIFFLTELEEARKRRDKEKPKEKKRDKPRSGNRHQSI